MKRPRLRFTLMLAMLIACVSVALGQGTTGSLAGTVSDPSGVVPNATVSATGEDVPHSALTANLTYVARFSVLRRRTFDTR